MDEAIWASEFLRVTIMSDSLNAGLAGFVLLTRQWIAEGRNHASPCLPQGETKTSESLAKASDV